MVCAFRDRTASSRKSNCSSAPVAVFYNVANGFHNAPNFMFNDHTVRKRDNISGFRSGVKVAGKVRSPV